MNPEPICLIDGCGQPAQVVACAKHWALLPLPTRIQIFAAWRVKNYPRVRFLLAEGCERKKKTAPPAPISRSAGTASAFEDERDIELP